MKSPRKRAIQRAYFREEHSATMRMIEALDNSDMFERVVTNAPLYEFQKVLLRKILRDGTSPLPTVRGRSVVPYPTSPTV